MAGRRTPTVGTGNTEQKKTKYYAIRVFIKTYSINETR
jgi:hypothetical protein